MKTFFATLICLTVLASSYGQLTENSKKDRMVYNLVSSYDHDTEKWSVWDKTDEVFVLNYMDKGDIARFRPNEKMILYKKKTNVPVETGKTSEGNNYKIIIVRESFLEFTFKIYDDPSIGLELNVGRVKLRFAKK